MNAATTAAAKPATLTDATSRPLQRRGWVVGVGAAGAAALVVKALPGAPAVATRL